MAELRSVSSTACKSKVERLITFSTSAVAVCCCNDFAQFIEQPRILDGDDGLGCEAAEKIDLLFGERPNLLAEDRDLPDEALVLEHGYIEHGSRTCEIEHGEFFRVARKRKIGANIGHLDGLLGRSHTSNSRARIYLYHGLTSSCLGERRWGAVEGDGSI